MFDADLTLHLNLLGSYCVLCFVVQSDVDNFGDFLVAFVLNKTDTNNPSDRQN